MDQLRQHILLLLSMPVYLLIIPLEIVLSNFRQQRFYSWKETLVNIYLNLLNTVIDAVLRLFVGLSVLAFFFAHSLPLHLPPVAYWPLLLLAEDLLFWLMHYVDHTVRIFWAVHVTHHSSPEYNFSTGFRSSVLMPVYKYFYFIPLAVLHFQPMDIIFIYSATQIYGILVHTQAVKKLPGWIEFIFVTPSHHRVHHACNVPYLDRNMGMLFIIWDRIFGTFTGEMDDEPAVFGINKPVEKPHHPLYIVTHEWRDMARDLRQAKKTGTKIKYLLKPPGWSPDGATQTSAQLQKEWWKNYRDAKTA